MKNQGEVRIHGREAKGRGRAAIRAGWVALVLGGLVWAAPAESSAKERCTSKPSVCARLKATRAAEAQRSRQAAFDAPAHAAWQQTAQRERCTTKPAVCALRRNAPASVVPLYVASKPASERCTTKPAVCARLKLQRNATPMTLAKDGTPPTID